MRKQRVNDWRGRVIPEVHRAAAPAREPVDGRPAAALGFTAYRQGDDLAGSEQQRTVVRSGEPEAKERHAPR